MDSATYQGRCLDVGNQEEGKNILFVGDSQVRHLKRALCIKDRKGGCQRGGRGYFGEDGQHVRYGNTCPPALVLEAMVSGSTGVKYYEVGIGQP